MSKYITIIILLFLLGTAHAQEVHDIKGSGYVLTQQRETGYFNSIEVSRQISVYIVQGELQPITVEADNNLFPYIKTVIHNKILKIYIPDTVNIVKFADMNVLISMPSIVTLYARQESLIDASPQEWHAGEVKLEATIGSRIKLAIKATALTLKATTSSTVELKGEINQLNADLLTSARLYGRNLQVKKANLTIATGARAELKVSNELEYDLNGNARLTYRGNPTVLKAIATSRSKVIHEK